MPTERLLTADELQKLDEQGIDSSKYKDTPVTVYSDEEAKAQQPTEQQEVAKKPISSLGAVAKTVKAHVGGYLGGGAGALGTGALIASLAGAPETFGASLLPAIAIAGGGLAGGYGGQKLQEAIQGEDTSKQLEEEASQASEEHPFVSAATDIGASALAGGGKPSIANLTRALTGNRPALAKIAASSLLNPAINTGLELATGQTPTAKDLLSQVAGGALFSEGADWAGKITGHKGEASADTTNTEKPDTTQNQVKLPEKIGPSFPTISPDSVLHPAQRTGDVIEAYEKERKALKDSQYDKMIAERTSQEQIPTTPQKQSGQKPLSENSIKITKPSLEESIASNNIKRPNTPQIDEEGNTIKYSPEQTDKEAYDSKYTELSELIKQGKAGTDEFQQKWKELEAIKNRNSGMPPTQKESGVTEPSTYSANLGAHIEDTKATVGSALKIISESDNTYKDLATHLLRTAAPEKLQVPIVSSPNTERSNYDLGSKSISLSQQLSDHYKPNVVIHEIGHALTSNSLPKEFEGLRGESLKDKMDSYLTNPSGDSSVKELIQSYYETANNLGLSDALFNDKTITNKSGLKGYKTGLVGNADRAKTLGTHGYSLGDLHEFVTSVFSDKAFQTKLNNMPSGLKDGKSMWSRILDSIKRILGLDVKSGSLLERALKAGNEIVEKPNTESYNTEEKKNAPAKTGDSPEEDTKRMGKFGSIFKSTIDKVKDINHPEAKEVAAAFQNTLKEKDERFGATFNKLQAFADKVGLTKQDKQQLQKIAEYENLNGKAAPSTMFRNARQKQFYTLERQVYDESGKYRITNNEPVYRNGQPTPLKQDPYSHPLTPNSEVINVYKQNTDKNAIQKLDKIFLDYQTKKAGMSLVDAKEKLGVLKDATQGSGTNSEGSNLQFYNAARRAAGITLPPEFTKQDYMQNLETYYSRQALDNTFYKNVESNPKVMSALGAEKDAWRKDIPKNPEGSIGANDAVKAVLKEFQGQPISLANQGEHSLSGLATSLFISNPAIELHKLGSNLIGIAGMADHPIQAAKTFGSMISNFTSGLQHATENGTHKLTARSGYDMFNSTLTGADRMNSLARGIRQISSLGDLTTKLSDGLLQAGAEYTIPNKISKANSGNESSQQLLKRLDPSYVVGKTYSPKEITQLASSLSGYLHGTHDGRTMPSWMSGDSELAGFFKLAHWSVAQTNRFMTDIYTPATKGDYKPLINGLFGAAIGGYIIKELREKIQGKHGQLPDLNEIASSSKGIEGNKGLTTYNLIAAAQYAGFGGLLSQIAKYPFDFAYKNNPQGATFPLDEITGDLAKTLGQVTTAIANDPQVNWFELAKQVTAHILTTDVQLARVGYNNAINSGLLTGNLADKKLLSDKLGELRRFNMVEGYPYEDASPSQANPYMNLEQKKFKRTQDLGEAVEQLPELINTILTKYQDHPDVMMQKLKALKENNYETFPSLESTPAKFGNYLSYLTKKEGPQAAQEALMDFFKHKTINEVKGSLVP